MSNEKIKKAEKIWYDTWVEQGRLDEGTCTLGNCIKTIYGDVSAPPVQGNISKSKSKGPALEYLAEQGIQADYYDGVMD